MPATRNNAEVFVQAEIGKGSKANKLLQETSPYLLQHAFNPVEWHPWGEEAFKKAREEDKPIFLSIGYSTCHWCHVMAHESFEDPAVAAILNRYFICIKVDREERPDVDQLYMAAVQAMTGSGGWPLSIFLTPELKPFYGGTYFPTESRFGLPDFTSLLNHIHHAWSNNRRVLFENAEKVTNYLFESTSEKADHLLDATVPTKLVKNLAGAFDQRYGGFGGAPKFPRPVNLNFLLRYHFYHQDEKALTMVLFTLRQMAAGGIYDHIGGGFHRYSVDEQWRVPHFEKMLYDQGQLAQVYLEAFQLSRDPFYAAVATDILDYVLRDLTDPDGGFHSALDADSPDPADPERHGEGLYYLWQEEEIQQLLGDKKAAAFGFHYGVRKNGNALADPQGEFVGKNILYVAQSLETTAATFSMPVAEVAELLEECRQELLMARNLRPSPHLDDKVITSWNGYMISALAQAYQILGKEKYLLAAEKSAAFLFEKLYDQEKETLYRCYRAGHAGPEATLDDYAFLVTGLIDLYETTFDIHWLKKAIRLARKQMELFEDPSGGGFYDTVSKKNLLVRMKSDYDGAEPTGNSGSALNLLRLAAITNNPDWQAKAEGIFACFGSRLAGNPEMLPQMLVAYEFHRKKPFQIIIAGKAAGEDTRQMIASVHALFIPNRIILLADGAEGQNFLKEYLPVIADIAMVDNRATAYVCRDFTCRQPTTDPLAVPALLQP
jgi:hypothetical protein